MPVAIHRVEREVVHGIAIQNVVGTLKLGRVMAPAFERLYHHLQRHHITCDAGQVPFTRYNHIDWERLNKKGFLAKLDIFFFYRWDISMGIPCSEETPVDEGMQRITLDGGRYLSALHVGPYMKIGDAYMDLYAYAKTHDLALKDVSFECYKNDPKETPEAALETEIFVPLA